MKITIYQNREVYKEESKIGNDSENKVETLEFEFPEEYEDFTKYIEFQIKGEKYVDLIENNQYVITREVAKQGKIKTQLVLKKNIENDVLIFKSNVFELNVSKSINASENLVNTVGVDLIEKIITKNNEQDTRLNNLESDNTTNKENILNLQNDNTTNKTNIKSLQDDNEVNKTDISNIKQEQITQNTNISNLQIDNTSNKAKILDLEAKNTEQDTNIQKNTDDIAEINVKNTAQDEEIAEINQKDKNQDDLIEQLQAENTKLKKEINSMQIPGEAVGNPIHLTDSSDLGCEIVVVGNAEQDGEPTPDTPIEVVTVGQDGSVEIDVCNKNIIDLTVKNLSETYGSSCKSQNVNVNSIELIPVGTWSNFTYHFDNLKKNTDYTINANFLESVASSSNVGITVYQNSTDSFSGLTSLGSNVTSISKNVKEQKKVTFNTGNYEHIFIRFWANSSETSIVEGNSLVFITEIQLEMGSTETNSVEHESKKIILPIQKEFVKIGDVEDTFVKVDGKWYEAHYHPKYTMTGNETILNSTTLTDVTRYIIQVNNILNAQGLCNYYKYLNSYTSNTEHFYLATNQVVLFDKENSSITFKNRLKSLYDNNTPVIVYPTLKEPELIECTEEQEQILNSFHTYKNITNITASGIANLKVNYKKDLETIINNLSQAIVGGN